MDGVSAAAFVSAGDMDSRYIGAVVSLVDVDSPTGWVTSTLQTILHTDVATTLVLEGDDELTSAAFTVYRDASVRLGGVS